MSPSSMHALVADPSLKEMCLLFKGGIWGEIIYRF